MILKPILGIGVGVMIFREGKILLGLRHEDSAKTDSELHGEGTWTMPGGKLHFGETFEETAIREVDEETGLEVKKEDLKIISLSNDMGRDAQFVTIGFLCEKFQGMPKVMEPYEITVWRWFGLDKLPAKIFPPSQKVLDNYLSGKSIAKTLKFDEDLAELILSGKKTATWRLFDDKDISLGDKLDLLARPKLEKFAEAIVLDVVEKPFSSLEKADYEGHETYKDTEEMYCTFSKMYKREVGPNTIVKIIHFSLIQKKFSKLHIN